MKVFSERATKRMGEKEFPTHIGEGTEEHPKTTHEGRLKTIKGMQ